MSYMSSSVMPTASRDAAVRVAAEVDVAHVRAHRGELAQDEVDRLYVACGEQLGQVLDRDPQCVDGGEQVLPLLRVLAGLLDDVHDRRQRRDVPDHRQRSVLRMQRQRDLVAVDQRVHRRSSSGLDPVVRDPGPLGFPSYVGIRRDRGTRPAGPRRVRARPVSTRRPGPCRRRTASGRCSAAGRRRSPSRRSAGRPRPAGSRTCTSRPCRCGG